MSGTAVYSELDPFCCDWLENLAGAHHIALGSVIRGDMRAADWTGLTGSEQFHAFAGIGVWSYALRLAGWPDDVPIWTGSCPCQPFSQAGRRKGIADDRHLWPEWFKLIRASRPAIVVGEQVASPDGLRWFDAVSSDMEGEGYAVEAFDLCAAGVGAPHIRQRLYFVALADVQRCAWIGLQLQKRKVGSDIDRQSSRSSRKRDAPTSEARVVADAGGDERGARRSDRENGRTPAQPPGLRDARAVAHAQ